MYELIKPTPKAFMVTFSQINRWDPSCFHNINWHWPSSVMVPIGSVLKIRKEKVNRATSIFNNLMPITIHFDGSIEPREVDKYKEYNMDLFWARPGDIVASKIDLKNGAVAIIPDNWNNSVVTSHFAIFEPKLEKLNPKYFHLLIQANFFKEHLWRNKVGAEGRKEVKLDFFMSLEIPLPSLSVQQKIVAHWEDAQQEHVKANDALTNIINELNMLLIKQTHSFEQVTKSKKFLVNYKNIKQWDLKSGRAAAFNSANPNFVRLGDFTEECTEMVRPWEEPEKAWPIYGVNNKEGVFLSSMQVGALFNAPYKIIKKDWFFHNPTRANVGSLGIVPEVPDDALTSPEYQAWRLKNGFLPDFMALMIKTDYFLSLVSFNRVGGVKQRMYYSNLTDIYLPFISEKIQESYAIRRKNILSDIDMANEKLTRRKSEIDQMILGTCSVEEK